MRFWPWPRRYFKQPDLSPASDETGPLHFIMCQIADNSHSRTKAILAGIVELASLEGGLADWIFGSLITVTFGYPTNSEHRSDTEIEQSRIRLTKAIAASFGTEVRLVYGCREGYAGAMGSAKRFSYTTWIPGFEQVLQQLIALPFGEAAESKNS